MEYQQDISLHSLSFVLLDILMFQRLVKKMETCYPIKIYKRTALWSCKKIERWFFHLKAYQKLLLFTEENPISSENIRSKRDLIQTPCIEIWGKYPMSSQTPFCFKDETGDQRDMRLKILVMFTKKSLPLKKSR
jgi:hypothetical protein